MAPRSRKQQLGRINHLWEVGLTIDVLIVAAGITGIALVRGDHLDRGWAYLFLAIALLGAVSAMLMTFAREKAGDDIDEGK
jgi:hypothetical protein